MKLDELKPNPNNPRVIKDERFKQLVKSLKEFPKMMRLRPMVVDNDNVVMGGNMRLRALKELGYTDIPDNWVAKADDLTGEEIERFIIIDNVGFGENDWDRLANEWDERKLDDWGMELPTNWGKEDIILADKDVRDTKLMAIVVLAYDDINDLDRITSFYELDSIDISEDIKEKIMSQRKAYVFKK